MFPRKGKPILHEEVIFHLDHSVAVPLFITNHFLRIAGSIDRHSEEEPCDEEESRFQDD